MSDDLRELYQDIILDHGRHPRNFHAMAQPSHFAHGHNPLCGDRFTLYLKLQDDRITDISFQGTGCAISTASASILTEILKGKTRAQADALFETFHDLVTGKTRGEGETPALGKLAAFSGVCEFPVRVKCATLVWHTLRSALNGDRKVATTE
jgi:nitrogen fixation NifU-like protein